MKKILLLWLVLALLLVACEKEATIVGSWYDETVGMSMVFDEGGVGSFSEASGVQSFEYVIEGETLKIMIDGQEDIMVYKIEGDQLELSFPDIDDFELLFTRVIVD